MAIMERDIIMQGEDPLTGRPTLDLPITRAGNIENSAESVSTASENDKIPIFTSDGVYMKTISVNGLFSGRSSSGTSVDIVSGNITIPNTGWQAETLGAYQYYVDVPVSGILTIHNPNVILDVTTHTVASRAGICSTVESFDGYIRFRSKSVPESAITGICTFINTSSDDSEHVTQYTINVPILGWENDSQNPEYPYALSLGMESIVESQYPTVVLDVMSQVEAQECGFCATVETYNGGLKFRTKFVPSKILSGICHLVG